MQKKYRSILVPCITALMLLSGCTGGHTHQTSNLWETNLNQHWKICTDCGQPTDEAAHTLDDSDTCTVCGTQIVDWGDSKSLYLFNESGDPLKVADYDADGTVITEMICQYEYDADGNLTHAVTTTDGVVTEESTYTTADGESVICQLISYWEDGSKSVSDYDVDGNVIRSVSYDSADKVWLQEDYEYALASDSQWYETKYIAVYEDGSKTVSEFSEDGDQTSAVHYDADGNCMYAHSWERTYDENGNWQTMKYYLNGVLTSDTIYATAATEAGSVTYPQTVTDYEEDGSKTVTIYDENDNIICQTRYDANGNIVS